MKLSIDDTVKFGILVGFSAIFTDASIAHGLWWENDPYWTYWITKTFLITTVFTIGTAFLGIGIKQGLIITAVHTLILEIYYEWFAPIGLPQEPWWLSFRDLWLPGFFVHYLVILSGYLIALWIWLRSRFKTKLEQGAVASVIGSVLLVSVVVVVVDGLLTHGLLLKSFPGWTFFIQHLLISFVFLAAWVTYVGLDTKGIIAGSLLLSLVWTTYSMYLGPVGLPHDVPRYLGYVDLWMISFPSGFVAIFLSLWLVSNLVSKTIRSSLSKVVVVIGIISLVMPSTVVATEGLQSSASASGPGKMVVGTEPYAMHNLQDINGSIQIEATNVGERWSHIQNVDQMQVSARFTAGESEYEVLINKAMARHPLGYATWMGVTYEKEMHGNTGVGTDKIPLVKPEIALWGWAEVRRDGQVLATNAPAHVMVMSHEPLIGIALEVSTEDKSLAQTPDGYLHVIWPSITALSMPTNETQNRELIGWGALLLLNGVFLWFVQQEQKALRSDTSPKRNKSK